MSIGDQRNIGLIPVVIGVAGHRDLRTQDMGALQTAVRNALTEIRRHCPNSDMIVLTSLAEGADRLCARAALALGIQVHALLPMPRAEYEKDFASPESLAEFRELLAQASNAFALPDSDGDRPAAYRPDRDRRYRLAGAYMARCCHILIALWDGVDRPEFPGGTSDIIKMVLHSDMRTEGFGRSSVFAPEGSGAVYHIVTPRQSNGEPAGEPFSLRRLHPGGDRAAERNGKRAAGALASIDAYNVDAGRLSARLSDRVREGRAGLYPDGRLPELPLPLSRMADTFAAADSLSVYFRNKRLTALRLLSALGLTLVALFLLYDELESNTMLLIYGAALAAVFICYCRSQRGGYHNKYVEYRVLAEGLRIQFYWKLSGIGEEAFEQYIWGHKREIAWIRAAMASFMAYGGAGIRPADQGAIDDGVKSHWIDRQTGYYRGAMLQKGRSYEKSERVTQWLFAGSIAIYIAMLMLELVAGRAASSEIRFSPPAAWLLGMHEGLEVMVRSLMKIAFGLVAGVIAFFSNYTTNQAFSEQMREFDKMHDLFQRAKLLLENEAEGRDADFTRTVLFQLGCEALRENGNWLLVKKQRPLALPK